MKIRTGFVSNSSSSSFVVLFPHEINDTQELYDLMWGEKELKERLHKSYSNFVNESMDDDFRSQATQYVLKDIKKQGPNNWLYALDKLGDCWVDDENVLHTYNGDNTYKSLEELKSAIQDYKILDEERENFDWSKDTDNQYEELEEKINDLYFIQDLNSDIEDIEDLLEKNKDYPVFYSFSYSDEDGSFFSEMEHGGIFGRLPNIVQSNH